MCAFKSTGEQNAPRSGHLKALCGWALLTRPATVSEAFFAVHRSLGKQWGIRPRPCLPEAPSFTENKENYSLHEMGLKG